MKFGFVTCVQLGQSCIEAIYEVGGSLETIITLHDDKARSKSGRVFVDDICAKHGIDLLKVDHVNDKPAVDAASSLDWLFIVGWSQVAGSQVINAPKHGVLGIHPTLLPIGRGRAAIPWAIIKGLEKTGVTMFKLDEGIDTGPIVAQREIPLSFKTTATELYERVNCAHVDLIREVFPSLERGEITLREQDSGAATIWPRRGPEDGEIDLAGSVFEAERLVRAVSRPYPGAFYRDGSGRKVVVWSAAVVSDKQGEGCLEFCDGYLVPLEKEVVS